MNGRKPNKKVLFKKQCTADDISKLVHGVIKVHGGSIHHLDIYEDSIDIPLDPLHCESIIERSALHNWIIKPHQHQELLHLFFLGEGSGRVSLDMIDYELSTPCVMVIPPRTVHGFSFGRDIKGHVITLQQSALDEGLGATADLREALSHPRILPADAIVEGRMVGDVFSQLAMEFLGIAPARQTALLACFSLILVWIARTLAAERDAGSTTTIRQDRRAAEFTALIERHYREGATLGFYASRLGITPTQLNNICRSALGRTAKRVVHDRVYLEARRNLVYTMLTINEIAAILGFSDPAYFARFFARCSGMSPSEFRRQSLSRKFVAR